MGRSSLAADRKTQKMKIRNLIAVIVATFALAAYAETPPAVSGTDSTVGSAPPTSSAPDSTAGISLERVTPRAVPNAQTTGARITITPMLLPDKSSPSWAPAAAKVIADALAGKVQTTAHAITSPTDYTICPDGHIDWYNLVDSQSTPLWQAQLNPATPFDQERGQELWFLVQAWSPTGINDVSMDAITAAFDSNDGHVLQSTVSFSGTSYTPLAEVQLADGTVINSGSASQQGQHVAVLVHGKVFTGGDTQPGLDQVHNWITPRIPYTDTCTVTVGSDSLQSVATTAASTSHPAFNLVIKPKGASVDLTIDTPESGATYQIWGTTDFVNWYLDGTIQGSDTLTYPEIGIQRYFKAQRQ